jgi:hypothetical protein
MKEWLKSLSSAMLYFSLLDSRRAMMHLVIGISIFILPNWLLVNNTLVRMWKEAAVAWFKVLPCHLSEGLRKPTVNLSQDSWHPSQDKIRHLPNTRRTAVWGNMLGVLVLFHGEWVIVFKIVLTVVLATFMCIVVNFCRFYASGSWSQFCLLHHVNFVTTPMSLFHFMISRIWHLC